MNEDLRIKYNLLSQSKDELYNRITNFEQEVIKQKEDRDNPSAAQYELRVANEVNKVRDEYTTSHLNDFKSIINSIFRNTEVRRTIIEDGINPTVVPAGPNSPGWIDYNARKTNNTTISEIVE